MPVGQPIRSVALLSAVVGPGRSGTTWVGSMMDSCPDVAYRFEPFHRMALSDARFRDWFQRLKTGDVDEKDIVGIHALLREAHPAISKAPFFAEKSFHQPSFGREQLWPLAKTVDWFGRLYASAFRPEAGTPIVFKEVTFIKPLQALMKRTSVPIVYVVRHPCATVQSDVRGQIQGTMPSSRQRGLKDILMEHAPALAEEFAEVVAGEDVVKRTALLWRCEVETCFAAVCGSPRGMVITYEQLAADAHTNSRSLFEHFGLEQSEQTRRYIDSLYALPTSRAKGTRRTGWGHKYFSIYRNPRIQKDAWIKTMSSEDRHKVESVVKDSPVVGFCAPIGAWQ